MNLTKAVKKDSHILTELTFRSKKYWGYEDALMVGWKEELTISQNYLEHNEVYKLTTKGRIVGFYAYCPLDEKLVKLNFLFVEPKYIGQGYGTILIKDFLNRIMETGYSKAILDADPNAEKFYTQMGFKVVGQLPSSIKNRFLPIMEWTRSS